jgi:hypothetical protein
MTDHERLRVAYFSEDTEHRHGGVTMQEVVSMLYQLGAKHRQRANEPLVVATTPRSGAHGPCG